MLTCLFTWLLWHFCPFHVTAAGLDEDQQPTDLPASPHSVTQTMSTFPLGGTAEKLSPLLCFPTSPQGRGEKVMPCRWTAACPREPCSSEKMSLHRQSLPLPGTPWTLFCCSCCHSDAPAVLLHSPSCRQVPRQAAEPQGTGGPRVLLPVCPREVIVP